MKTSNLSLVPLRIPTGWCVVFNVFSEIDPILQNNIFINSSLFSEDLLSIERLTYENSKRPYFVIDLGWYPPEDINGFYRLNLVSDSFQNKLKTYETKDRSEVCRIIENWLGVLSMCMDEKEVTTLLP